MSRTRDLAVRKIVGASRFKIISHLFGETVFLTTISMLIALIGVELLLPGINSLLDKRLELAYFSQPELIFIPLIAFVLVLILSGVYPAIISSSFNMASLLKGVKAKSKISVFRKSLLILQFVICAGLITSALIIRAQAKYMIDMDLGYNVENVENIGVFTGGFADRYEELKTELERIPQIEQVSGSSLPNFRMVMSFPVENDLNELEQVNFVTGAADVDFVDLFKLEIVEGESFAGLKSSEVRDAVLINETAVAQMNVSNPIGMKLANRFTVIGVLKDFHFASAKNKIKPILITHDNSQITNVHFKFRDVDREVVMLQVKEVWQSFNTDEPFETTHVASFFNKAYQREVTLMKIFNSLTFILISIALLGLFALASFESQLREKELGIRKVLGASYLSLLKVLNKKFLWVILIALLISIPITYLLINKWLVTFPYRVENVAPYFVSACAGVIVMGILILGIHGYQTSRKNAIEVLRNE